MRNLVDHDKIFELYIKNSLLNETSATADVTSDQMTDNSAAVEQQMQRVMGRMVGKINNTTASKQPQQAERRFKSAPAVMSDDEFREYSVWKPKAVDMLLKMSYDTKDPLLIYGESGIGKTDRIVTFAKSLAKSKGKQYVEITSLSEGEKDAIFSNPSAYFALVDIKCVSLEPVDLRGIPDMSSKKAYLEGRVPDWIWFMAQPDADGILFFDEINQGHPDTLKALFDVVLKKTAGGKKFAKDFTVIAAGNLGGSYGNRQIPPALTSRFTCGVFVADPADWLTWAESTNDKGEQRIDDRIIAFVKSDPQKNFFAKPPEEGGMYPTPRQHENLSRTLKLIDNYYDEAAAAGTSFEEAYGQSYEQTIATKAAGTCGPSWAREFVTFLERIEAFDVHELSQPGGRAFQDMKSNVTHALAVFIVRQLKRVVDDIINGVPQTPYAKAVVDATVQALIHVKADFKVQILKDIKRTASPQEYAIIMAPIKKAAVSPQGAELKDAIMKVQTIGSVASGRQPAAPATAPQTS